MNLPRKTKRQLKKQFQENKYKLFAALLLDKSGLLLNVNI